MGEVLAAGPAVEWAAARTGRRVIGVERLIGGMTSTMLRLQHDSGESSVLRLVTEEPWRSHGAALVRQEAHALRELLATSVPAPRSMALDASGGAGGAAAHLMSWLPGDADAMRADDAALHELAAVLAAVHELRPEEPPRRFQSWAWEEKRVVPPHATEPDTWRRAFDVLATGGPGWKPCFLQRDFGPHNVLWTGDRVSGVVDWVETSTGPAWLDVAHGASNLALRHGTDVAARFASAYVALTGREPEPYWDVLDVVGFLPAPGGRTMRLGASAWRRLELHLARVLRELG